MDVIESIKFFGGISGIAALLWKLYETFGSYLQLDLQVTNDGAVVTASASIINKGVTSKTLDYALLLIGPESESPIETAQQIARGLSGSSEAVMTINATDDIVQLRRLLIDESPQYLDKAQAVIPLPFFYAEQVDIGDEVLKHRCTIDPNCFNAGAYSVRFFVFPRRRLLRCTQDLFIRPPAAES